MITFFLRRFITSALVVLVSTFVMYILVDIAIDPLAKLRGSTAPNKQQQMDALTAQLHLDDPITSRYFDWLKGAFGCAYGQCDLGRDWEKNQAVTHQLSGAITTTLQLVTAATLMAILFGIAVGIVSALRQYTGFDYSITFMSFLLYSLPVFWVAVLLKYFLAIDFNDWLQKDPQIPPWAMVVTGAVFGLAVSAAIGGTIVKRARNFAITVAGIVGFSAYANARDLFVRPSEGTALDLLIVTAVAVGFAFGVTTLSTGLRNRRALYSSLTVAGIGAALYYPMLSYWDSVDESWPMMIGLAIVAIVVGIIVGFAWGGPDWTRSARTAALTAIPVSALLFVDRLMQSWYAYVNNGRIKGRPIATLGSATPNLEGSFWIQTLDLFTHLLLPTVTLVLISFAGYTRYTRASTLEVLNQDYIRTARSKGLTERTVIMRHAFRNALLPLASIVPVDIITIIGGALLTETVFGWFGMGRLFVTSLGNNLQDPVMAYILIVGIFAVLANFVADLVYAVLDPRIRVSA
jgi:peptide/nickel transport system permease protein